VSVRPTDTPQLKLETDELARANYTKRCAAALAIYHVAQCGALTRVRAKLRLPTDGGFWGRLSTSSRFFSLFCW
jgi:hypothetical protein